MKDNSLKTEVPLAIAPDGKVLLGDVWEYMYAGELEISKKICSMTRKDVAWVEYGEFRAESIDRLTRLIERDGKKIEYEHIVRYKTPKLADCKDWPEAEFWSDNPDCVAKATLVYFNKNESFPYITDRGISYKHCRIVDEVIKAGVEVCPTCGDKMKTCTKGIPSFGFCERGHKWKRVK